MIPSPFQFAMGYALCASVVSLFLQASAGPGETRARIIADAAVFHAFGALVGATLVGLLSVLCP